MLESFVILYAIFGFASLFYALEKESITSSAISILFWFIFMAGVVYVEVPGVGYFMEYSSYIIALGCIFVNIIWILVQYGYLMRDWKTP